MQRSIVYRRLLFDRNIPDPLARHLTGFEIRRTQDEGWNTLKNGDLLNAAERAGFVVMLSADQSLRHQQNLLGRKLGIVVLSSPSWTLIRNHIPSIQAALDAISPGEYAALRFPRTGRVPRRPV